MISARMHKILACLAILLWLTAPAFSGISATNTAEIEAAFLVQFSKYVYWPAQTFSFPDTPVVIGILGRDRFGSKIDRISRTFSVNGRAVEIRRLRSLSDAKACHILFIAANQSTRMATIKDSLAGSPVLLVSHMDDFLSRGGMINFVILGTKMRFNINLTNCKNCGIKISSKLLNIAHQVIQ